MISRAFIDCSNLCHRAHHATGQLEYNGKPTGVIYGFFLQWFKFASLCGPHDFVFCWDAPPYLRKKVFPGYKLRPEPSKEEKEEYAKMYAQMDLLRNELLPYLGYGNRIVRREGYEADDLIAWGTNNGNCECKIISSDEDLYQLIGPYSSIFNPNGNKHFGIISFIEKYPGIKPNQWPQVKALAGCTSDKVPGVQGVGETTAIKYLTGQMKATSKTYFKIKTFIESADYERNLRLVKLPFKENPNDWAEWLYNISPELPQVNKVSFYEVFKEFGFDSFIGRLSPLSIDLALR